MRRIATLLILVGLFTVSLFAGDTNSAQPASDLNAVAGSDQAQSAPEAMPAPKRVSQGVAGENGGWLFKSIFGEGLYKKTGIIIENYVQAGCATNTATDHYAQGQGNGNWPDPVVNDTGCAAQDMDMAIHRDLVSNIVPGVGPVIGGPTPKSFSWGFYSGTMWGRSSLPAAMSGYDKQWSVNDPADYNSTYGAQTRSYVLSTPIVKAMVYLPLLKGMELSVGRMGTGIGWDIPPQPLPGPDFFASKTFIMVSVPSEMFGAQLSANIMRSHHLGYLMAEFAVINGMQTYHPVSGSKDFEILLHYRTPHGATGIKVMSQFGPGNVLPGTNCSNPSGLCGSNLQGSISGPYAKITPSMFYQPQQVTMFNGQSLSAWVPAGLTSLPAGVGSWGNGMEYYGYYHVISPNSQDRYTLSTTMYHNFGPKVKWVVDFDYTRQNLDGKSDTIIELSPNHYLDGQGLKGYEYAGIQSFVTYQFKPKWAIGVRGEHFKNQDGMGMYPTCGFYGSTAPGGQMENCRTNLDEITLGLHYTPSKSLLIFPEIRYDFQDDNHGLSIFGINNLDVADTPASNGNTALNTAGTCTTGTYGTAACTAGGLPAGMGLYQNSNAHTHNLIASMNFVVYF